MKTSVQHNDSMQVVSEGITTLSKKSLSKNNILAAFSGNDQDIHTFKQLVLLVLLSFAMQFVYGQTPVTGGKQAVPHPLTGGKNNESESKLTNNTGMDMWDVRVIIYKQGSMKSVEANHGNVSDKGPLVNPKTSSHIKFTKAVKQGENFEIKTTLTGPNDSIYIIPTDSLGSDIMVNRDLNPVSTPAGTAKPEGNKPTPLKGGKVKVKFDSSNYPSLVFVNNTGQPVCDLRISAAKAGNGGSNKIDSVFIGDKKVFGAPPSSASVHVYFPCIAVGGTIKVTVKIHGIVEIDNYIISPTNKDSGDITGIDTLKKATGLDEGKLGKTVKLGDGTTSPRPSTTFVNETGQDICDLFVKTTKPIKKIIVNGKEWKKDAFGTQNGTQHVVCGTEPCIPNNGTLTITIILANGEVNEFTVIPTNAQNNIILVCSMTGGTNQFLMPNQNSPFGLSGRSGSIVAINESCSPISQLVFTSPDPGITVNDGFSTSPYTFDTTTSTLIFTTPIAPGAPVDFTFRLNTLLPYSPTDSFPYTTIDIFYPGSQPFDGWYLTTPPTCSSSANGSIDFGMSSGTGPFTYLWSNGTTTEDLSNINAGTYTVTVSSPSGCMLKTIVLPDGQPSLKILPVNVWCNGAGNGAAFAYPSGLMEPLNYLWSNGMTTQHANGLNTGLSSVMITDAAGCTLAGTLILTQPTALMITGTTVKLNCNGDKSGAININAGGGNSPYTFVWNSGNTNQNRTALAAGTYTLTVTDGFGCQSLSNYIVKQPQKLVATATGTDVACFGGINGTASATATGGTKPYTYNWSNGMTTANITAIPAGAYNLNMVDLKGCTTNASVILNQPPPMNINVFPTGPGQAMAQVFGGTPNYQFLWNTVPPQNTPNAIGLMPGQTYTVTVMDAHGCMQTGMISMPLSRLNDGTTNFAVSISPNPTQGLVSLSFNETTDKVYEVKLIDLTGKIVYEVTRPMHSDGNVLDFSNFSKGIYTLKVSAGEIQSVSKLVIN